MPELDQFKPEKCTAHAVKCCWPRDRQANDNNGNCNSPYDSDCIDKDAGEYHDEGAYSRSTREKEGYHDACH